MPVMCISTPTREPKRRWPKRRAILSCVGATPLAVTDNLNFGSPEKNPLATGSWPRPVEVWADACRFFETPVTGGNVSLYNETLDSQGNPQPIYPTPVVGMVGRIDDLTKTVGQGWQQPGDIVLLAGHCRRANGYSSGRGTFTGDPGGVQNIWQPSISR